MKNNSAIFLLNLHPVYNPLSVKEFDEFEKKDSVILFSALLENLVENIKLSKISLDKHLILDDEDQVMEKAIDAENFSLEFLPTIQPGEIIDYLSKATQDYKNNLIIVADSIGISSSDLVKYYNLLNIEDDSLLVGKTNNGILSFIGFNKLDIPYIEHLFSSDFSYEKFLSKLDSCSAFIHTIGDLNRVIHKDDFKNLYTELSKKESLKYCSQEMHERFTHIFVEYKDLLK